MPLSKCFVQTLLVLAMLAGADGRPAFLDAPGIGTRSADGQVQDLVKYLKELDQFLSHVARPRFADQKALTLKHSS